MHRLKPILHTDIQFHKLRLSTEICSLITQGCLIISVQHLSFRWQNTTETVCLRSCVNCRNAFLSVAVLAYVDEVIEDLDQYSAHLEKVVYQTVCSLDFS